MRTHAGPASFGRLPGPELWQARLPEELDYATAEGRPLSIVLVTVLSPTDTPWSASPASEGALALVAESLRQVVRGRDQVYRLSESRFAVLLLGTDATGTAALLRRLPGAVQQRVLSCLPENMLPALALGSASAPLHGTTAEALVAVAAAPPAEPNGATAQTGSQPSPVSRSRQLLPA
jgi:hypothetical protein